MQSMLFAMLMLFVPPAPVEQPSSFRTVAVIEVSLHRPADRSDLLEMLRRHAAAGGLHVDDVSHQVVELQRADPSFPDFARRTIYVGVFRGTDDIELEVSVDDAGHPGRAWIIFLRGVRVEAATRLREELSSDIRRRWPYARAVPVLPTGGRPNAEDLILTPSGYRIIRARAAGYELPDNSPLLAPQ